MSGLLVTEMNDEVMECGARSGCMFVYAELTPQSLQNKSTIANGRIKAFPLFHKPNFQHNQWESL